MSNIWKSTTQLSILLTKPVESDLIYKKNEQIMGYCVESARKKICRVGKDSNILGMGGQVLLGGNQDTTQILVGKTNNDNNTDP